MDAEPSTQSPLQPHSNHRLSNPPWPLVPDDAPLSPEQSYHKHNELKVPEIKCLGNYAKAENSFLFLKHFFSDCSFASSDHYDFSCKTSSTFLCFQCLIMHHGFQNRSTASIMNLRFDGRHVHRGMAQRLALSSKPFTQRKM